MTVAPKLKSEKVIINSPMSFAGAAQRSMRLRGENRHWLLVWGVLTPLAIVLVLLWWVGVIAWYVLVFGLFGVFVVFYRLLRRGARKRKAEALRHREMMAAIERQKS